MLARAAVIDFAAVPARSETGLAGLLLALADLVALDLPALTRAAGYPGTSVIPAVSWLLSLLALKLTGGRRVSHVDDLIGNPASALFAGLAVLSSSASPEGRIGTVLTTVFPALIAERGVQRERCRDERDT